MSEQIEWEGYVERITFRNEENGYTVLFLVDAEEEEEVCCVGQFSYVADFTGKNLDFCAICRF